MKSFKEHITEASGITHAALSKKVAKMFDSHKEGDGDFETVHLKKKVYSGSNKHQVGSLKDHQLGYRPKATGNAYTGGPWERGKKYAEHPLKTGVEALIKKHGGTPYLKASGKVGGWVDTSDGYRHHFGHESGSNFSTFEHSANKRTVAEDTIQEAAKPKDLHHVLAQEHGFVHKEKHLEGYRPPNAKGTDHYTPTGDYSPEDTHKILTKAGYTHLTRSKADSTVKLPPHTHYEKEEMGSRHAVTVVHKNDDVLHIEAKHHRVRD